MVAHLSWATWAICSWSLICLERSEQIAHSRSSDLSEMSKWVNELWANEWIPGPATTCIVQCTYENWFYCRTVNTILDDGFLRQWIFIYCIVQYSKSGYYYVHFGLVWKNKVKYFVMPVFRWMYSNTKDKVKHMPFKQHKILRKIRKNKYLRKNNLINCDINYHFFNFPKLIGKGKRVRLSL